MAEKPSEKISKRPWIGDEKARARSQKLFGCKNCDKSFPTMKEVSNHMKSANCHETRPGFSDQKDKTKGRGNLRSRVLKKFRKIRTRKKSTSLIEFESSDDFARQVVHQIISITTEIVNVYANRLIDEIPKEVRKIIHSAKPSKEEIKCRSSTYQKNLQKDIVIYPGGSGKQRRKSTNSAKSKTETTEMRHKPKKNKKFQCETCSAKFRFRWKMLKHRCRQPPYFDITDVREVDRTQSPYLIGISAKQ